MQLPAKAVSCTLVPYINSIEPFVAAYSTAARSPASATGFYFLWASIAIVVAVKWAELYMEHGLSADRDSSHKSTYGSVNRARRACVILVW